MSTKAIRLIRDGETIRLIRGGDHIPIVTYTYTVTTEMIPALRWAAMRAILTFQ